jgi:AraC family transcriptional regulator, regulatory protein of adaptative response / methylated-DNA-[protein]-cysteine methyltransferase
MDTIDKNPQAETLRFGYGETQLGLALVALSARGIVAILLGDDRQKLRRELSAEFADAQLIEDDVELAEVIARIVAVVDAPQRSLDLPLDVRGSDLELAVWKALQANPAGETRTYGALAKAISVPATAQEVGAACAANRLAVAIPCHRVVKADGSISGYRWGVRRKRRLINMEGVA